MFRALIPPLGGIGREAAGGSIFGKMKRQEAIGPGCWILARRS